jgi:hypothetical protein
MSPDIDITRLRIALRDGDPEIAPGAALFLLAESSISGREKILGDILRNGAESVPMRSAAATALGRIPTAAAESVLLANLDEEEPTLRSVLVALGAIGRVPALAAIEQLQLPEDDARRAPSVFAVTLIAHRLRLPGHDVAVPPDDQLLSVPDSGVEQILASPVPADEAAKVVNDLRRQPYGIEYEPDQLIALKCRRGINVLCPNRELVGPAGRRSLIERKALAGTVALKSPETGGYSVSYLLQSSPSGEGTGVHILAPRCSARQGLAGQGTVESDALVFELHAVGRPGATPILLRGRWADDDIHFDRAALSVSQVPARTPALARRGGI